MILLEKQRAIQIRKNSESIGAIEEVLVEGRIKPWDSGSGARRRIGPELHSCGLG